VTNSRPAVPTELRRRVLVEAGHRCAIPTCRHIQVDVHHIVPYESCNEHKYENLIALCPNCHRRADNGEIDKKALRMYKANLRYAHDKFSQFEVDLLFLLYKAAPDEGYWLPIFMRLLLIRLLEAEYIEPEPAEEPATPLEEYLSPDFFKITNKGREFIDSLGLPPER